jgi:hypothetical protein
LRSAAGSDVIEFKWGIATRAQKPFRIAPSPYLRRPYAFVMALSNTKWKRLAQSRFPHEREAQEFLAQELPDSDPTLLYTNFEFIADDGSVNEVDAVRYFMALQERIWLDVSGI